MLRTTAHTAHSACILCEGRLKILTRHSALRLLWYCYFLCVVENSNVNRTNTTTTTNIITTTTTTTTNANANCISGVHFLADFGSGVTADSVMMQAGEIVQTVTILNVSAWYCQLGSSGKPNPIRWQSLLPSPELEWQHPQVVAVTIVVVLVVILKRAFFLFFAKNCTQNTVL